MKLEDLSKYRLLFLHTLIHEFIHSITYRAKNQTKQKSDTPNKNSLYGYTYNVTKRYLYAGCAITEALTEKLAGHILEKYSQEWNTIYPQYSYNQVDEFSRSNGTNIFGYASERDLLNYVIDTISTTQSKLKKEVITANDICDIFYKSLIQGVSISDIKLIDQIFWKGASKTLASVDLNEDFNYPLAAKEYFEKESSQTYRQIRLFSSLDQEFIDLQDSIDPKLYPTYFTQINIGFPVKEYYTCFFTNPIPTIEDLKDLIVDSKNKNIIISINAVDRLNFPDLNISTIRQNGLYIDINTLPHSLNENHLINSKEELNECARLIDLAYKLNSFLSTHRKTLSSQKSFCDVIRKIVRLDDLIKFLIEINNREQMIDERLK